MPPGHGVEHCSLRFYRKGRQLDIGESSTPTQIFQQNLLPESHQLWAFVCSFTPGLMEMMVIATTMAMAMAMAMLMMLGW
jgi:hypothetical protein